MVLDLPTLPISWAEGELRVLTSQLRFRYSTESQGLKSTEFNALFSEQSKTNDDLV